MVEELTNEQAAERAEEARKTREFAEAMARAAQREQTNIALAQVDAHTQVFVSAVALHLAGVDSPGSAEIVLRRGIEKLTRAYHDAVSRGGQERRSYVATVDSLSIVAERDAG